MTTTDSRYSTREENINSVAELVERQEELMEEYHSEGFKKYRVAFFVSILAALAGLVFLMVSFLLVFRGSPSILDENILKLSLEEKVAREEVENIEKQLESVNSQLDAISKQGQEISKSEKERLEKDVVVILGKLNDAKKSFDLSSFGVQSVNYAELDALKDAFNLQNEYSRVASLPKDIKESTFFESFHNETPFVNFIQGKVDSNISNLLPSSTANTVLNPTYIDYSYETALEKQETPESPVLKRLKALTDLYDVNDRLAVWNAVYVIAAYDELDKISLLLSLENANSLPNDELDLVADAMEFDRRKIDSARRFVILANKEQVSKSAFDAYSTTDRASVYEIENAKSDREAAELAVAHSRSLSAEYRTTMQSIESWIKVLDEFSGTDPKSSPWESIVDELKKRLSLKFKDAAHFEDEEMDEYMHYLRAMTEEVLSVPSADSPASQSLSDGSSSENSKPFESEFKHKLVALSAAIDKKYRRFAKSVEVAINEELRSRRTLDLISGVLIKIQQEFKRKKAELAQLIIERFQRNAQREANLEIAPIQEKINQLARHDASINSLISQEIRLREQLSNKNEEFQSIRALRIEEERYTDEKNREFSSFLANNGVGIVGAIVGVFTEFLAGTFFVLANQTQQQLSRGFDRLRADRRFRQAVEMTQEIDDDKIRNNCKARLVLELAKVNASDMEATVES